MARYNYFAKVLALIVAVQSAAAFVPPGISRPSVQLAATGKDALAEKFAQFVATTAVVIATSPLVALAEEVDDYEYGAVNAPIWIAWAAGALAILTALLPVLLQGGEEAFEEMKDRDKDKWGSGGVDTLKGKKKK